MEVVEESPGVVGTASFLLTEEDFIASHRALKIVESPSHDIFLMRLCVIVFGHLFLLGSISATVAWLIGVEGANGPIPPGIAAMNLAFGIIAAWALYTKIYAYRKRLGSKYRASPLAGEKISYGFTPSRVIVRDALSEVGEDWGLTRSVVELRDGFVLIPVGFQPGRWIPKHAFQEPFGVDEAAALFRSKVKNYKVIDRFAGLPDRTKAGKPALPMD